MIPFTPSLFKLIPIALVVATSITSMLLYSRLQAVKADLADYKAKVEIERANAISSALISANENLELQRKLQDEANKQKKPVYITKPADLSKLCSKANPIPTNTNTASADLPLDRSTDGASDGNRLNIERLERLLDRTKVALSQCYNLSVDVEAYNHAVLY